MTMELLHRCKRCGEEKPVTEFWRNKHGYSDVCRACALVKRVNTHLAVKDEKRISVLSEFTPRELMLELKRRGFEGQLTVTETHIIDLAKID